MTRALALALALVAQCVAGARADTAAMQAAALLEQASRKLEAASDDAKRLVTLGAAAAAQEQALAALRDELRRIARRRAELRPRRAAAAERAGALALALARMDRAPPVAWLAHPGGPLAASRAAMAMTEIAPALARDAAALRADIAALDALEAERRAAATLATDALAALNATRAEIARRNAARRAARPDDPALAERLGQARALLARSAATLTDALTALPPALAHAPARASQALSPPLPAPATGRVATAFGDATSDGPANGVTLSVAPYALVRAPALSTLRYAGPVGRFAQVAILEVETGMLIVLAGLGAIDRSVGETILAGEPIGAMVGPPPASDEFLMDAAQGDEALSSESLYIEIRRDGAPIDPASWFAFPAERKSG